MRRVSNMPPEECFTRALFGVIMILAVFVSWGKWVTLTLGILFLISAFQGFCLTCVLFRKFTKKQ